MDVILMAASKIQAYFFFTLLVAVLILSFLLFLPYLSALLFAAGLAIVFHPVYTKLLNLFQGRDGLAALTTIALLFIIFLVPLSFFGFQIFQEAQTLYAHIAAGQASFEFLETVFAPLENQIREFAPEFQLNPTDYAQRVLGWVAQNFTAVFSGVARFILTFSLGLLALYYLFVDGKKVKRKIVELSPLSDKQDEEIFAKLQATVQSVIRGSLAIAFLQGILTGIGFTLFGVPNATLWGGLAFVAALMPSFGTALILIPGVIFLFLTGHTFAAIGLAIWGATAVGLVDNILGPRLIQRGLPIHPFLILLSVVGGLNLFGLIGFLLGPLILSLLFALLKVYQEEFQT